MLAIPEGGAGSEGTAKELFAGVKVFVRLPQSPLLYTLAFPSTSLFGSVSSGYSS